MITQYLSIDEVSSYSGFRKSFLYALVEGGDIPHYKIGRLIRFKKEDFDMWMETHKVDVVSPDTKAHQILQTINRSHLNIDRIIKKTVAEVKENVYTPRHGRPDRIKGLGKEVKHGSL